MVIPHFRAGYLRVTHPFATLHGTISPKQLAPLPVRLACVKHAASVHPEPGSNSPYVRCRHSRIPPTPSTRRNNNTSTQSSLKLSVISLPTTPHPSYRRNTEQSKTTDRSAGLAYLVTLQLLMCHNPAILLHPCLVRQIPIPLFHNDIDRVPPMSFSQTLCQQP